MKIETALNIGDTCWCIRGKEGIRALTVGLIRVEKYDSPGTENSIFDNFKPQKGYKEEYMCIETGIKSGSIYELNLNVFISEKEAIKKEKER